MRKAKEALKIVRSDATLIAYPNSGEEWSHDIGWHGSKSASRGDACLEWHQEGNHVDHDTNAY